MLESLANPQVWVSLVTLTALEVVLSVDNLVVIAILVGKLPPEQQPFARKLGMALALLPRLILLFFIGWVLSLTQPLFTVAALGHAFTGRDLILAGGGAFLLYKATHEIHGALEGEEGEEVTKVYASVASVVTQIALVNLVFSIDSIITAIGMTDVIWVMAVAVLLSMLVLMFAARPVGEFVERHPTVKMMALSFLLLIGTVLVADGFGVHFPHGYIYAAMGFSVFLEMLNMTARRRAAKPVDLHDPYHLPKDAPAGATAGNPQPAKSKV